MFIEILIGIAAGITAGIFTGLSPGIHVNLVSALIVSTAGFLLGLLPIEVLLVFIISLAITHTFLDFIPSIFLGAPDPDTALSVLPGHRLLLEGKGLEAVKLTILGSILGLLISFALYKLYEFLLERAYSTIEPVVGELIFFVCIFIVFRSNKPAKTGIVLLLSGALGLMVLNSRLEEPLFPLLTGLFGTSTLLFSLKEENEIPKQDFSEQIEFQPRKGLLSAAIGSFSGFLTGILPGIGSSTAATIGTLVVKDSDVRNFLILTGSIATVNFFMSIAALNVLGKARNGAIIALMKLQEKPDTLLLVGSALVSAGISVFIGIFVAKRFIKIIEKIDYGKVAFSVILLLCILTFVFSGPRGFSILVISTLIGIYANLEGVPRTSMMACIMFPVMAYFI